MGMWLGITEVGNPQFIIGENVAAVAGESALFADGFYLDKRWGMS